LKPKDAEEAVVAAASDATTPLKPRVPSDEEELTISPKPGRACPYMPNGLSLLASLIDNVGSVKVLAALIGCAGCATIEACASPTRDAVSGGAGAGSATLLS
jgi:hypothetical protein